MDKEKDVVAVEGVTIKQVLEKQEFDLKEMVEQIANVPSVYMVENASSAMIIRRLGYNGFTVVYTVSKRSDEISLDSYDQTPDHIISHIERKGEIVDEGIFYVISKEFSKQKNHSRLIA